MAIRSTSSFERAVSRALLQTQAQRAATDALALAIISGLLLVAGATCLMAFGANGNDGIVGAAGRVWMMAAIVGWIGWVLAQRAGRALDRSGTAYEAVAARLDTGRINGIRLAEFAAEWEAAGRHRSAAGWARLLMILLAIVGTIPLLLTGLPTEWLPQGSDGATHLHESIVLGSQWIAAGLPVLGLALLAARAFRGLASLFGAPGIPSPRDSVRQRIRWIILEGGHRFDLRSPGLVRAFEPRASIWLDEALRYAAGIRDVLEARRSDQTKGGGFKGIPQGPFDKFADKLDCESTYPAARSPLGARQFDPNDIRLRWEGDAGYRLILKATRGDDPLPGDIQLQHDGALFLPNWVYVAPIQEPRETE